MCLQKMEEKPADRYYHGMKRRKSLSLSARKQREPNLSQGDFNTRNQNHTWKKQENERSDEKKEIEFSTDLQIARPQKLHIFPTEK